MPSNPDRVPKIAEFWDSAQSVSDHREFRSARGKYKGVTISALSTGIGPPGVAIAITEASRIGVNTFVRVGSTGAIQRNIACGDLVISAAAVRLGGTSNCYVVPEYPTADSYEVLLALIEAAETLDIRNYHLGVTATTSDFYAEQNRQARHRGLGGTENSLPTLQAAAVLNFDMKTATLFTLAALCGLRSVNLWCVGKPLHE